MNYIADITNELLRCFEILNKDKFNGELPEPIITIQEGKKGSYGHCSTKKIWIDIEKEEQDSTQEVEKEVEDTSNIELDKTDTDGVYYEINIAAKYLNLEPEQILNTLLHECVHLKNAVDGVKDCSGNKHNKKFKALAEKVGFTCEKDEKVGYGYTIATLELENYFRNVVKLDKSKFKYYRYIPVKIKDDVEKKSFISYICPVCEKEAKGEEGMLLKCADCDVSLEEKPKGKRGRKAKNAE